jgi:hypothetical protein
MAKTSFSTRSEVCCRRAWYRPSRWVKFGKDRYVVQLAGKLLNASDELSSVAPIQTDAFKKNHHWRAEQGAIFTAAPSHTAPSHSSLIETATR